MNNEAAQTGRAVSWEHITDSEFPDVSFELQRAVTGGEFETVYEGEQKIYYDADAPANSQIEYRVRTVSGESYSPWVNKTFMILEITGVSNIYLGIDGNAVRAAGVFVGVGGVPVLTTGQFHVKL